MVLLQKFCCFSLKTGSLIICYFVLTENVLFLLGTITNSSDVSLNESIVATKDQTNSTKVFNVWTSVLNIIIDCTAIFGIYKQRPTLLIPFLAYRTVNLIFLSFSLLNSREITNSLTEKFEQSLEENDHEAMPDLMPHVITAIVLIMAWDLYCILVLYSFYQVLLQNARIIAVNVPIVTYSVQPPEAYVQPPVNPYLFQAQKYPYQYENSKYVYNQNATTSPNHLPPPYGT